MAHIYLRRNQSDVLAELPPLMEVEEWIEPKPEDIETYENAVQRGHFMDMRQAFSTTQRKMERITELLDDGADGAKTIIFTYFRSVLDGLVAHLGDRAFDLSPAELAIKNVRKLSTISLPLPRCGLGLPNHCCERGAEHSSRQPCGHL